RAGPDGGTGRQSVAADADLSGGRDASRRSHRPRRQRHAVPDWIERAADHDAERRPADARRERQRVRRQHRRVHGDGDEEQIEIGKLVDWSVGNLPTYQLTNLPTY